ncbi:hypothetical protein K457DRAFT_126795 [Linnemannia elongata AG-77]|uniref:Uncharacterized protein n=1 Tax=Linnemannia elongata AG-77 TaxID=1314771 RepID=A0A197JSZ2_9FUNG|nr:hypothetical protein K457DRAFT_126795 [Linnemannia elongata AG-77]
MSELGMYLGIAIGCLALLGVCGGILYRKYRQDMRVKVTHEQHIQDRLQQVADLNLPPFYVDHELDPVCIYEHELPPDVLPPVQPIFVHSASSDEGMLIPPEDDPLFAQGNGNGNAARSPESPSANNNQPAMHFSPAIESNAGATGVVTIPGVLNASGPAVGGEGYFDLAIMPTLPTAAAAMSPSPRPTTPSSIFSASSVPVPRPINQEMLNLARVRAPPSYDVPNVVVDRSPLYHPFTHSSHSVSSPFTPYSEDGHHHQGQDDYFGHGRLRAHTISHPSSSASPNQSFLQQLQRQHQQHQQQQRQQTERGGAGGGDGEEDLPATPRYSLEFPSDVPHEHHLEHHQRSRALYDNSVLGSPPSSHSLSPLPQALSPGSFSSRSSWDYYERDSSTVIRLNDRTPSISSLPGSHSSSPLLMFETTTTTAAAATATTRTPRRSPAGLRARASTLGESSRALMQRMHSLLRHSTSYSGSRDSTPATSPRLGPAAESSLSSSSPQEGAAVQMVGLGLEYGGHYVAPEPLQLDQIETQEQEQVHDDQVVVVVDEPEEDTSDISLPPSSAPSGPTSQHTLPSTVPLTSDSELEHESAVDEVAEEEEKAEEEVDDDQSVSKAQHQLSPSEPMQTIPMPLAVS